MRPSEFNAWSRQDQLAAVAMIRHQDDIGPCGEPHSVSTDEDMEGWYDINAEVVCWACAAIAQYRKDLEKSGGSAAPGAVLRIVNTKPTPE